MTKKKRILINVSSILKKRRIQKKRSKRLKRKGFNVNIPLCLSNRRSFKIQGWDNALCDEPAFILGNGPSIIDENISLLEPFFTIGINRIFDIFDPTILFWQDIELWSDFWRKIIALESIKVAESRSDPEKICVNFNRFMGKPQLSGKPDVLYGGGNTGLLAVQFAFALGCDPLILLGMDCNYRDNKTDFYGRNKYHKPHTLGWCKESLRWMKNNEKLNIINCSDNKYWPREKIANIIKKLDRKGLGRGRYQEILRETKYKRLYGQNK